MMSWMAMALRTLSSVGRGDGLIVGVGVQRVAVVVDGIERLQRGADVVEVDLLRVEAAAAGLDVVFEHLAALIGTILLLHGLGPDAPRHATDDRIFGVDAVAEEEAEVGPEGVDVHAPAQVILHEGEAVGEGESELRDGVGARLGNVVARNGHRVEVPHLLGDEILLHIAHEPQRELGAEDAGVLRLVLLQDVGLHRAPHFAQRIGFDLFINIFRKNFIACQSEQQKAEAVVPFWKFPLIGWPCDAFTVVLLLFLFSTSFSSPFSLMYFSHSWSMAAFMKKPSSMGAGPLMVMLTEVMGCVRSKPE
jgi:hypothetical protein